MAQLDIELIKKALEKEGTIYTRKPMSDYTSFRTGGPAELVFYPKDHNAAADAVAFFHDNSVPFFVLGGCTNLVVGDAGIDSVVVKMSNDGVHDGRIALLDDGLIYADAGIKKSDFIKFAIKNGKSGIEFMVGIPGCIGGGIIMNAGTYMGSFSDVLKKVKYISSKGEIMELEIDSSKGHYRHLELMEDTAVVLGAYFSLPDSADSAVVQAKVNEIIADRKSKHPWEYPSAGSVFKNPENHSSWKLVNDSGLKGYTIGGAQVSEKHTNFIINRNNATSAEIRALVSFIQKTVKEKFNVELSTEIRMVGKFI